MSEMEEKQFEMMEETIKELEEERKEEKKYDWIKWIALSTAIIAVFAAIATLRSNMHTTEALLMKNSSILATAEASDKWAYYQAKSIKANMYEIQVETLTRSGASRALIKEFNDKVTSYQNDQKKIADEAKALEDKSKQYEVLSENNMRHHAGFALSEVFFQVAIALSSVAAMTKRKELWYFGLTVAGIGFVFFCNGFLLFVPLNI